MFFTIINIGTMNTEKTIKMAVVRDGKEETIDVRMRYCAATENGFEQLRNKSVYDLDVKSQEDLIALGVSAIVAAYTMNEEEPPVSTKDILYSAKPTEIVEMVKTVIELRAAWYEVPAVVPKDEKTANEEQPKN